MECPGQSFHLAPSRRLLCVLYVLHLAALAGLAATALPPTVMLALAALLLASLARHCSAHGALARRGGTRLEFRGEAWWLHGEGSLMVLGDSLPRGELRRLRVLLHLRGAR